MISNILKEPTINNKEYLISDVLNKSMISTIFNQQISNNLKRNTNQQHFKTNND